MTRSKTTQYLIALTALLAAATTTAETQQGDSSAMPTDLDGYRFINAVAIDDPDDPLHGFHHFYLNETGIQAFRQGGPYPVGTEFVGLVYEITRDGPIRNEGEGKAVHLFGVVLLVGNVIVTLVWKLGADRTGEPSVIAFGQRLVTLTDWWFTLGGVVLILIGGYGAAWVAGLDPFGVHWLLWGQVLFVISGLLWALILIPAQIRQARQATRFATTGLIPADYWRDARRWTWWGILAIVPLLGAIWIMIAKPAAVPAEPTDRLNRGKQEQIPRAWTVSTEVDGKHRGATEA